MNIPSRDKKRIVITGGTGFTGKACITHLQKEGFSVLTAGRRKSNNIYLDLGDPQSCMELKRIDNVYAYVHLGARIGWDGSTLRDMYAENVLSTGIIAQIAARKSSLLVFASAAVISGLHAESINEKTQVCTDTEYAKSKFVAEECINASGCTSTILRIGGIFGDNGPIHLGINTAIQNAKEGIVPTIYGDGTGKRNYIYVDDVGYIIAESIKHKRTGTHLVGGKESHSIEEMMNIICHEFELETSPIRKPGESSRSQLIRSKEKFTGQTSFRTAVQLIKANKNKIKQ